MIEANSGKTKINNQEFYIQQAYASKIKEKLSYPPPHKQRYKEFVASRSYLKEKLKGVHLAEVKK